MQQIVVGAPATARRVLLLLLSPSDGMTPVTGEVGQPAVSVNGEAWSTDGVGALVEVGRGYYYAELESALLTTPGDVIAVSYSSETAAEAIGEAVQVIASPALAGEAETARASLSSELAAVAASVGELVPPTGARALAVTVETSTAPIPEAWVAVYAAGALVTRKQASAAGALTLALDDGTYEIRTTRAGYSFDALELVVAADAPVTISGVALTEPVEPSAPNLCVVYDWFADASGNPLAGALVRARVVTPGKSGDGAGVDVWVETRTDAAGYAALELVQGASVELYAPRAGYAGTTRTGPAAVSRRLSDWS